MFETTASGDEDRDSVADSLALLAATHLVETGELDEAEKLLSRNSASSTPSATLDMLARVLVRKGQFQKARQLWLTVLERDNSDQAAKAALARLRAPWLAFAIAKRLCILTAFAIGLVLAAVGLLALARQQFLANPDPSIVLSTRSREQHISASRIMALVPQPQPASTNARSPTHPTGSYDARLEP